MRILTPVANLAKLGSVRIRNVPILQRRPFGLVSSLKERFNTKKKPADQSNEAIEVVEPKKPFFQRKWHQYSGKLAAETEVSDILVLEKFITLSATLKGGNFPSNHPIQKVIAHSQGIVHDLWIAEDDINATLDKMTKLRKIFAEVNTHLCTEQENRKVDIENYMKLVNTNFGSNTSEWLWNSETALRLSVFQLYTVNLLAAVDDGTISIDTLHSEEVLIKIINTFLSGSSHERLTEHLKLYGPEVDQAGLQDAFYALYEPEVAAVTSALTIVKGLHKDHIKKIPKFAKTYLLDRLELNVKSRCVFCWSDPAFSGVKPPDDDHTIQIETLLEATSEYFNEGYEVGNLCANTIASDRRTHYQEKNETRKEMRQGFLFFLGCCVIDTVVTYM
jgi:hypothetical protein